MAQRLPRPLARHPARHAEPEDTEDAAGSLLSRVPGAKEDGGEGFVAVIREAWINGVSTRKVDELVHAMAHDRHLQILRFQAVQGYRRAGESLPQAPPFR